MAAEITFDQPLGAGPGVAGKARNDIWLGQVVDMTSSGTGTTYLWELLNAPRLSEATISNPTAATASITPDVVGTYRIQLTTDDDVVVKVIRARYDSVGAAADRGWALPAVDEEGGESDYGVNDRAWSEVWEAIVEDLLQNGFTVTNLGGDLADWSPASDSQQRVVGIDTMRATLSDSAENGLFVKVAPEVNPSYPREVIRDGDILWIAQQHPGYEASAEQAVVWVMDLTDNTLITTVNIGKDGQYGVRSMAQDDDYIYCSCWNRGAVAIISKATRTVVGWGSLVDAGLGPTLNGVCADNAGNFYACGFDNTGDGIFKWSTAACLGAAFGAVTPSVSNYNGDGGWAASARNLRYYGSYLWLTGKSGISTLRKLNPVDLLTVTASVEIGNSMDSAFDGTYVYVTTEAATLMRFDTTCTQVGAALNLSPSGEMTQPDTVHFDDLGSGVALVTDAQSSVSGGNAAVIDTVGWSVSLFTDTMPARKWGGIVAYNGDFITAAFEDLSGGGPA